VAERPTVQVVGRRLDPEHHRLRDMLTRANQDFEWFEAGSAEADALLERVGAAGAGLPVVVDGDEVYPEVTPLRLAEAWHLRAEPSRERYELIIVGAGPAGLSAGVYAASDGLSVAIFDEDIPGGQASHTSKIENFVGFLDGIPGSKLVRTAGAQIEKFGGELCFLRGVVGAEHDVDEHRLELSDGRWLAAPVVIAAPGMIWRTLDVPGVDELRDRGVYYGAGRSEARAFAGSHVAVVGGGNSAGQAALTFGNAGARVSLLVRGKDLRKSMSEYLVRRIEDHPLIEVHLGAQVTQLHAGGEGLTAVTISTGERLECSGLFLCIGGVPRTQWADGAGVKTDRNGFICTGPDLLEDGRRPDGWPLDRDPLALETTRPGLFAAGDARSGSVKRVGSAVGEGSMAVALTFRRLEELGLA
jgi:thioredoxin reductase (NADPH)